MLRVTVEHEDETVPIVLFRCHRDTQIADTTSWMLYQQPKNKEYWQRAVYNAWYYFVHPYNFAHIFMEKLYQPLFLLKVTGYHRIL